MKKSVIFCLKPSEFKRLIENYAPEDICDRFHISRRTLSRAISYFGMNRENYGRKHLEITTVEKIRSQCDRTQQSLAKEYGVSQPLISKIINNQIHRPQASFGFSGSAEVRSYGN